MTLDLASIHAALTGTPFYRLCDNHPILSARTRVEIQGGTETHAAALRAAGYTVEVKTSPIVNRDGDVIRTRTSVAVIG